MTKELFFDTETSAMLDFKAIAGHPRQPARILQFGALLYDDGKLMETYDYYVMPDVWDGFIDPEAQAIHKITMEKLKDIGKPMDIFRDDFDMLVTSVDVVVCHNFAFDWKMAAHELALAGRATVAKETYCTMLKSTPICNIIIPPKRTPKWPKLTEAYYHFFNESFEGAHDALNDVKACEKIYRELQKMGVE